LKTLLLHPGTQYSHRLACELRNINYLYKFVTGLAFTDSDLLIRLMPERVKSKVANRIFSCSMPSSLIKNLSLPEVIALFRLYRGMDAEQTLHRRNESFQLQIPEKYLAMADNAIGFDTSSWIAAERMRQLGKPFFLDQSIAHPKEKEKIYEGLRTKYPDWSQTILKKKVEHLNNEQLEYSLSTRIVVASSFTKKTLVHQGVPSEKIIVNPYGVATNFFIDRSSRMPRQKIRFLYLGLLGVRKGLPFLMDVWIKSQFYNIADLWIAGPADNFALNSIKKIPGVHYKGKLAHKEIPQLLRECDCLVFPSFFEGFGQVILESMAAGLPVITTDATAGPDIIEHGIDGFITEAGNEQMLAECMSVMSRDRSLLYQMGDRAVEKARSFSWSAYGQRWKNILQQTT
jgi:starch synthase